VPDAVDELATVSCEDRRKVEPKAVDTEIGESVERLEDQMPCDRTRRVGVVAAARVVGEGTDCITAIHAVVTQTVERPRVPIAFARVVEHHVEPHLDAMTVRCLDEIGELTLAAQVRLLRVLQEKQIERVGGQEMLHVDVRIVTATHRDRASMVHQRAFREDLWYRINVFPILLPTFSERREDIPELARHFARKASTSFGIPYVEPTYSDIDQLIEYHWPGNIRELQAVIDRAVILGRGVRLEIATSLGIGQQPRYTPAPDNNEPTFYEVIPESIPPIASVASVGAPATPGGASSDARIESLNESMKRHIERALIACGGQIEGKRGAAETLRINPHTLRAKMRKLGIRWSDYRKN
jgi:transcriptional regulator with GAF, ATPase, and Fis domain